MTERAAALVRAFLANSYDFWTGVPCSYLAQLFAQFQEKPDNYLPALREDAACGLAAGAYLGGRLPVIAMQNSGFGSATNAVASLLLPYKIPAVFVVSWRGESSDSQEHDVMGRAFPGLISSLQLPSFTMSAEEVVRSFEDASTHARQNRTPVVISVPKGVL